MANLVLVEDHALVRQGVRSYLKRTTDHEVVAEYSSGRTALRAVHDHRPDAIIVDLSLPELDGLEVIRRIHKASPDVRIIVLSMHSSAAFVAKAFENGARGYVLKSGEISDLADALDTVMDGREYLSADLEQYRSGKKVVDDYEKLTNREREILHMIAEGTSPDEIRKALCISKRTADTHRMNLMNKLGLHSIAELMRFAFDRGLVEPPTDKRRVARRRKPRKRE